MSRPSATLKELEKRLRDEPDNLGLRVTVAGAYHDAGRVKDAVELYRSVAVAYRDDGRRLQALATCRSILAIAPDDAACRALVAELEAPPQPEPLPPIPVAGKRAPLPDTPAPPRRPEVLITRISSSDRLDETPLPAPVPYHVADPTASIRKLEAAGDLDSITGVAQAARGSHVDVTAELDTRQRVRVSTEELDKLVPPPGPDTSGIRLATPLPVGDISTEENPALTTKMERIDDDGEADRTTEMPALAAEDEEAEPLPPVRTSSKPGLTARRDDAAPIPAPLPPAASGPLPVASPPVTPARGMPTPERPKPAPAVSGVASTVPDADTENEPTRPHEVFDAAAIQARAAAPPVTDPIALSVFSHLPLDRRPAALARFAKRALAAGEVAIARDDTTYPFLLVLRGQLEVRPRIGRAYLVGPGEYAGEASMLAKAPSRDTVLAATDAVVLALAPADFYDIVASYPALWAELKATARRRAMASL